MNPAEIAEKLDLISKTQLHLVEKVLPAFNANLKNKSDTPSKYIESLNKIRLIKKSVQSDRGAIIYKNEANQSEQALRVRKKYLSMSDQLIKIFAGMEMELYKYIRESAKGVKHGSHTP